MRLYQLANELAEEKEAVTRIAELQRQQEADQANSELLGKFKIAFSDYLEMITEAGITYHAIAKDGHIVFSKNGRIAEMDFSNKASYRFYDEKRGFGENCSYGDWNKNMIASFLAQAFPLTDSATV